jgi:hypothetical protein
VNITKGLPLQNRRKKLICSSMKLILHGVSYTYINNSFNLASTGLERYQIIKYSGITDSTYSDPSSYCCQPSKHVHLSVINFDFPTTIGPIIGLPSKCIDINNPHNNLSNCVSLDSSSVCYLKRSFSVSLAAISDRNSSFPLFIS